MSSAILIRPCRSLEELGDCVNLQREVWGLEDGEVVPRRSFVIATKIGGQVIGAFETGAFETAGRGPDLSASPIPGSSVSQAEISGGGEGGAGSLVGFAMAMPAFAGGRRALDPYLHSHMLAVAPGYRNRGIGRRLKLFQRQQALERGILRMEWTFDPLEVKNAYLNIHKLGAIVRRYASNMYGVSSSRLQGTLPTDRLYAEWWMASRRVREALDGRAVEGRSGERLPVEAEIVVPAEAAAWRGSPAGRERALELQSENRLLFERAFTEGLAVHGYRVDAGGNGVFELAHFESLAPELKSDPAPEPAC